MITFNYSNDAHVAFARNAADMLGRDLWYLRDPLKIDIIKGDDLYEIDVPRGYLTDGASVPRVLWSICPKWDRTHRAVILHDYLCEYGIVKLNGKKTMLIREQIDALFLHALQFEGLSKLRYSVMYAAIRAHANIYGLDKPKLSSVKLQLEDEIRLNLKEDYCK